MELLDRVEKAITGTWALFPGQPFEAFSTTKAHELGSSTIAILSREIATLP